MKLAPSPSFAAVCERAAVEGAPLAGSSLMLLLLLLRQLLPCLFSRDVAVPPFPPTPSPALTFVVSLRCIPIRALSRRSLNCKPKKKNERDRLPTGLLWMSTAVVKVDMGASVRQAAAMSNCSRCASLTSHSISLSLPLASSFTPQIL